MKISRERMTYSDVQEFIERNQKFSNEFKKASYSAVEFGRILDKMSALNRKIKSNIILKRRIQKRYIKVPTIN